MKLETDYFETSKSARYSTYGELSSATKYFWFGLHGSKMLCEQVLYKFKDFDSKEHFIVAPEALSRFYEKDFGGPVVASWMTKRDRLREIKDNGDYLSSLYQHFTSRLPKGCQTIVMAFSQGGTIAFRWLHSHKIKVDFFLPYACWIPEDIDLTQSQTNLKTLKILFSYGTEDQFLTSERIQLIKHIIASKRIEMIHLPYAGDHRISKKQLKFIFEHYIRQ
ncbi:MAG: alpha/beta hydrolase [Flavobacteriaceae bacterium]